jgi:uncharacterized protein (DUF885 family)
MHTTDEQIGLALRLIEDAAAYVEIHQLGPAPSSRLPDLSETGVAGRAATARLLLGRLDTIDRTALPLPLRLAVDTVAARAPFWASQDDWFWTVFDPSGAELFGLFAPTAYCGGYVLNTLVGALAGMALASEADRYRYLAGLSELGQFIAALHARTAGQMARGIYMPRGQAVEAGPLLARIAAQLEVRLRVGDARLPGHERFKAEARRLVATELVAALDAFAADLDQRYVDRAPDRVGIGQYPDGPAIYRALVKLHSSTGLSPEDVHEIGLERVSGLRQRMRAVRDEIGFAGDDRAYRAALDADPRWRASTPEGVAAVFQDYIDRIEAHIPAQFPRRPAATYDVGPLPEALSEAMTFGYFQAATPDNPHGRYLFNAANLIRNGLFTLGPLTYHELVPGHHLQLARQMENEALPLIRRRSSFSAFAEGWAEYAAHLAEELGLYRDPAERFGRLVMEAFLACRLVVDTGMNALGWSLERARDYLRENSFMPEKEIASETLRYACDVPGQALAYKLGDREILRQRERVRAALGESYDQREFHELLLDAGAMPMGSLNVCISAYLARQRS